MLVIFIYIYLFFPMSVLHVICIIGASFDMPFWRHACFMQIKGVWGALKMREWKMQEWKMRERQSMESHKKKYSKAPDEIWLSWLSCLVLAKRNSQASRRVNVATNHRQCVRCQQSYPRSGDQTRQETR